ncbi:hypothetical protein HK101_009602 [Irineochytrium annulatum]|nr:hypothetical protein HK101_009602 [Irineochytrium annulatum]
MTVEDLKTQGNKAFSSGDFKTAIGFFSQAIEQDPKNHVLFSNRSACHASLKDYVKALEDAEETVKLNPSWAKGYSRQGAAYYGLARYKEAVDAYKAGVQLEPANAQLKKGLEDAESALAEMEMGFGGNGSPFAKLFQGDVFAKIAGNPKLAPYLSQPDFMAKVRDCQSNPRAVDQYMQDPRMMNLVFALMGIDASAMGTNPMEQDGDDNMPPHVPESAQSRPTPTPAAQKKPEPEPMEEDVSEEEAERRKKRKESDAAKEKGTAHYKKREFEEALKAYDQAWALDETNIAVLTNKSDFFDVNGSHPSAVLFEMGKFEECIKVSEEAVEKGRELRVDYKLVARHLNDLANAIKYYQKSLSEHRTKEVLEKLREVEKAKKLADKEAYRSVPLSDEAREKGNVLFKESKFADAVPFYTEAIKRNDADPRNYSNRAACYVKLMALPEAERDCEEAIKLDENFVKAYIRKASIQHAKRDFVKAMEVLQDAKSRDVDGKHANEIEQWMVKCYAGMNEVQSGANREETVKRAMNDPEVQRVLGDPVMQTILQQMKEDPSAFSDHMKNPAVAAKIRTLINAGIIQMK